MEGLEPRVLLSAAVGHGTPKAALHAAGRLAYHAPAHHATPATRWNATPSAKKPARHFHARPIAVRQVPVVGSIHPNATTPFGLTPDQVRGAYGVNLINFGGIVGDGTGQTIAIVDAYDYPTAAADLHAFDVQFGLPDPPSFKKLNQTGGTKLPGTDPAGAGGWSVEEALDIEWAHAMAPRANIILFEASAADDRLFTAVRTAANTAGVVAVSMSWSDDERNFTDVNNNPNLPYYDAFFQSPAGRGVTFLAATGDSGAYAPGTTTLAPQYPATSPNVVAVGGTSLTVNANNAYGGERGWGYGPNVPNGGGGAISTLESQPTWQAGVVTQSNSQRTIPDVAMVADPNTGVPVYDTYDYPSSPWQTYGGTSLSCPLWAGLIAIADQGRALAGQTSLDGPTQTLPRLYQLPASDFHDVTAGNNGYPAGAGYDLVTGIGTPIANQLVPDLAGLSQSPINTLYLKKDADGTHLDQWINAAAPGVGTPTQRSLLADASGILLNGAAGTDALTLDYSAGNFAAGFAGGITYNASADGTNNRVAYIGTAASDTLTATATTLTPAGGFGTTPVAITNVSSIQLVGGSGGADALNVTGSPAGGFTIDADAGASAAPNVSVNVTGSNTAVRFASTQRIAALSVGASDNVTLTASPAAGGKVLVTNGLTVADTGRLDLTNNAMVVNYTTTSPISSLAAMTQAGASAGITSSVAGTGYALGYAEAADVLGAAGGTFLGQTVGPKAVLVRFTRNGDANLDGTVDFADFVRLSNHFGSAVANAWSAGDFNGDGTVDFADFVLLSNNFGTSA